MPGHIRTQRRLSVLLLLVIVAACTPPGPPAPPNGGSTAPGASAGINPSSSTGAAASAAPFEVPPAAWTDCGNGFQCAPIAVPRDYDDLSLGSLTVQLIRLPASRPKERIGSLILNPGGPGGSGVEFVRSGGSSFSRSLRRQFDLVGFDPRGVNTSSPVRCIDNLDPRADLDPSPDSDAELRALVRDAKDYAAACERRNADLLPYLSTDAVAQDLDVIRRAVGDELLTYVGYSYGTLIGALYADRYPDRIRAMVLDGAIDPSLDLKAFRAGQAEAFETALGHFFRDCSRRRACPFHEGGDTRRAFDRLMRKIDAKPLPTLQAADRRSVGPGLAWSAVLGAMYSPYSWESLAASLALAKRGDGSFLLLISDPFRGRKENGAYSNQIDAYFSNVCLDYEAPTSVDTFTSWARSFRGDAPHFAKQIGYNDLSCAYWSVPSQRTPAKVSADGAPPIVVIGTTGDPATPYPWAKSLAKQLDSGTLITYKGEGHTAYLSSSCVERAANAYLIDLKKPKNGLTC